MKTICALLILGLCYIATVQAECDVNVDGVCFNKYTFDDGGWTYDEALIVCEKKNSKLAEISTSNAYAEVFKYLLSEIPDSMVLTGLRYQYDKKKKSAITPTIGGKAITYTPNWFENHPIQKENYREMVIMVTNDKDYRGYINTEENCRFTFILCSK